MSWLAVATAFTLGVTTSISPCPLTTNLLAISFLARGVGRPSAVLRSGVAFTLGAAAAYVAVAAVAVWLLSASAVSQSLQRYMGKAVGPVLVLVGMLLLELLTLPRRGGAGAAAQKLASHSGPLAAAAVGAALALSFCPVTAAWFFGSLLPLAAGTGSVIVLPLVFGLGFALPVLSMCVLLSLGSQLVSRTAGRLAAIEKHFRNVVGAAFIVAGIAFSLRFIFGVI